MKLASIRNGERDGALAAVSRDLTRRADASTIAPTLQRALDDWERLAPKLEALAEDLERDRVASEPFDEAEALSPLPRAHQWADASAYLNHVEIARKARGATLPDALRREPLLYQGGSDSFLAPRDPIPLDDEEFGLDFEAEVAVAVDDVAMGSSASEGLSRTRLVMLCNDVSLRGLIPDELAKGFGFFQSKPSSAFSPVAATPDELGGAWREGRVALPILSFLNGEPFGRPRCDVDMTFSFGDVIAHASATRSLGAGSVIGSGTVSNRDLDGGAGRSIAEGGTGYSCLLEARAAETLREGTPRTPFMRFGDVARIEMRDEEGRSIFGAIEQRAEKRPLSARRPE